MGFPVLRWRQALVLPSSSTFWLHDPERGLCSEVVVGGFSGVRTTPGGCPLTVASMLVGGAALPPTGHAMPCTFAALSSQSTGNARVAEDAAGLSLNPSSPEDGLAFPKPPRQKRSTLPGSDSVARVAAHRHLPRAHFSKEEVTSGRGKTLAWPPATVTCHAVTVMLCLCPSSLSSFLETYRAALDQVPAHNRVLFVSKCEPGRKQREQLPMARLGPQGVGPGEPVQTNSAGR